MTSTDTFVLGQEFITSLAKGQREIVPLRPVLDSQKLNPYYVETKDPFVVDAQNNWLDANGVPAGKHIAMSAGYWTLLDPLTKGHHTILFGGTSSRNSFYTRVQYEVEVS